MQERCVAQSGGTIRLPLLVNQQRKRNAGLFAEDAGVAQIAQTNGGEARPLLLEFLLVFAQLRNVLAAKNSAVMAKKGHDRDAIGPERTQSNPVAFGIGQEDRRQTAT